MSKELEEIRASKTTGEASVSSAEGVAEDTWASEKKALESARNEAVVLAKVDFILFFELRC